MIKAKIENLLKNTIGKSEFEVFVPEKEVFGHYSTNAALRIGKAENKNPSEVAGKIVEKLEKTVPKGFFEKIEIANPGFINFWLSAEVLQNELKEISRQGENYGRQTLRRIRQAHRRQAQGKKVMVEFTDPNPFKEFHIGHLYSNIVGETLSRLLEASAAKVKRANYQGDVGLHVAKAVWGMRKEMERQKLSLKKLESKPLDFRIKFMGSAYAKGNRAYEEDTTAKVDIIELNKKIFSLPAFAEASTAIRDKEIKALYQKGRAWSLAYFEKIYKRLGTKFDFYYFEREVGETGLQLVKENIKKGIFEESEGAIVFPGEKYGLHRRVFINSEGLPTYEAKELGLETAKFKDFPADAYIVVTGNEIIDYFKVVLAALRQINPGLEKKVKHIAHGMVRFASGKMSSRSGEVIKVEELLEEMKKRVLKIMASSSRGNKEIAEAVALGAVKYSFLKTNIGQDIVFDFEKSLSLKGDSGPYLQYTYARLRSILRKAPSRLRSGQARDKEILPSLVKGEELRLTRKIIEFPDIVRQSAESFSPNYLAKYLYELADLANHYYESTPILSARGGPALGGKDKDINRRRARLILISTVSSVLKSGLGLSGIKALERI